MAESNLTHPTYKFVDEKEADAIAWVFTDPENMKRVPFKFPELKANEIRAKVTYAGLCHSDAHTVRGEWGGCSYPLAPGHEIVGRVTHVGSDVKDYKVGDKVGFGCQRECCEKCVYCKSDTEQLCKEKLDQTFTYGPKYWGGYATAIQHPHDFFFKVPEGLPEERVPPLFCAGVTVYAPIARYAKPGDNVAVLGIGGLGHMAVQYAKAWGCNVTAFTTSKDKEEFIKKLGADNVVLSNEETFQQEAGKFQVVLNTLPASDNLTSLVSLTKPLGTFVQIGLPAFDNPCKFNPAPLIFGHVNYTGSLIGSRKEIRDMLEFSTKHNIVPLCEQFDFEEFPKAYDTLLNGRPKFRCVVNACNAEPKH